MGTSPLVDKSALAHSASVLDMSVLTVASLNESTENSDEVRLSQFPFWLPYPLMLVATGWKDYSGRVSKMGY